MKKKSLSSITSDTAFLQVADMHILTQVLLWVSKVLRISKSPYWWGILTHSPSAHPTLMPAGAFLIPGWRLPLQSQQELCQHKEQESKEAKGGASLKDFFLAVMAHTCTPEFSIPNF